MKKKILINSVVSLWLFTGCIKDGTTTITGFVKNPTTHTVKINFYNDGVIAEDTTLVPGGSFKIGEGVELGKVGNGGIPSDYSYADSVALIFDGLYRITHYVNTPSVLAPKHYLYTSLRNVANYKSYEYSYEDVGKISRRSTYTYTFTEQDYLDAK